MATPTTTVRTVKASTSLSAGNTETGAAVDLTTRFGGTFVARIANGATGPGVGCDCITEVSRDNSEWREYRRQTAGVANSGTYDFSVPIPPGIQYARQRFTGNTSQAVTVESYFHEVTSIG